MELDVIKVAWKNKVKFIAASSIEEAEAYCVEHFGLTYETNVVSETTLQSIDGIVIPKRFNRSSLASTGFIGF